MADAAAKPSLRRAWNPAAEKEKNRGRRQEREGGWTAPNRGREERAASKSAGVTEVKWQRAEKEQISLRVNKVTWSSGVTELGGKNPAREI